MCSTLSKSPSCAGRRGTLAAISAVLVFTVATQAAETTEPGVKPEDTAVAASKTAEKRSGRLSDESAIRAAIDSYAAAYNRGDARAVASHWSESGEWTSPSGQRFQGRPAIEKELQAIFAESKGVKIEILHQTVRLISPDVGIDEAAVRVVRPGEPASDSTYLAIQVKKGGQWKLDCVHETNPPEAPPASSALQDLAWLVGEWIDQSPDATIEATVAWTKNKTFLTYSFKASAPGMDDLEGTQVIGWDPAAGTLRSWMFDSDGGFGEGTWSKKDNHWVVKFHQVLPDGRQASATNIYSPKDADTFTWTSIGRKVDGEFLPNIEEVKIVRKTTAGPEKQASKPAERPRRPKAKN